MRRNSSKSQGLGDMELNSTSTHADMHRVHYFDDNNNVRVRVVGDTGVRWFNEDDHKEEPESAHILSSSKLSPEPPPKEGSGENYQFWYSAAVASVMIVSAAGILYYVYNRKR